MAHDGKEESSLIDDSIAVSQDPYGSHGPHGHDEAKIDRPDPPGILEIPDRVPDGYIRPHGAEANFDNK